MAKKIYRTIIRYEILTEEPIVDEVGLDDIAYQCAHGDWSGRWLPAEENGTELTGKDAVEAIKAQGSEPEFFNMDDEGNEF